MLNLTLGGSLKSWLYTCFGPTCGVLAKKFIESAVDYDKYTKLKLSNCHDFLYFNKGYDMQSLYQSMEEQLYAWQWHYYQIPQTKVEPDDIVMDCGCAEGVFSLLNHNKARHIYAFEPLPQYLDGLYKTFATINSVTIVPRALGDTTGEAFMDNAGIASSVTTDKSGIKITIDTIDNYCNTNKVTPTYLKVDVEGYELELLKGAYNIIKHFKPKIAITTYHKKHHDAEIEALLLSINSNYHILKKGIDHYHNGGSVMLHAW